MSIKETECRLQIGDVCCSLAFADTEYCASVREYYKGFLSEKEPELHIDVNIILHQEKIELPNSILMSKTVDNNNFIFHSGLINGFLDIDNKYCSINVKNVLFTGKSVRIFEQFLCQVYYTLLKRNHPDISDYSYIIHGCAVRRDCTSFLFSGPSGSGKSTIAKLSSNYYVLNDELVNLTKLNGSYMIRSTPFQGDHKGNGAISAPLNAIFLIKHGKKNKIRPISKTEFVSRFVREVMYSQTLLSVKSENILLDMMGFCVDVAENVPFYELQFLPDGSFWDSINEMNKSIVKEEEKICCL